MDDAPGPAFSHFGICVSDLERSLRFYCEALGFEKAESHDIGSEFARLMDLSDVSGHLAVHPPRADRDRAPRLPRCPRPSATANDGRVNQLGLTHLSFRVPDVAGTAARIVELGGAVVESSRTIIDLGGTALEFVYCTDPDGVRVELMDLGG